MEVHKIEIVSDGEAYVLSATDQYKSVETLRHFSEDSVLEYLTRYTKQLIHGCEELELEFSSDARSRFSEKANAACELIRSYNTRNQLTERKERDLFQIMELLFCISGRTKLVKEK